MAGSAALFRDWFHDVFGSAVDNPGVLYTNLLLMGDRTDEDGGTRMTTGYDGLWGAGKLRLRTWDGEGLDGPAGWSTGSVCIDQGETYPITIGTGALPSDVDVIRATAWWYDHRHDEDTDNDRVTLRISHTVGGTTYNVDDAGSDNRRRIHIAQPTPGYVYTLKLIGTDVTSDLEGCGDNSARVHWAWFYEDSDRETAEGLETVRPE